MEKHFNEGRIHLREEELCSMLGFEGGTISFIGWMKDYGEIGVVISHPDMPLLVEGCLIPQVDKRRINK